jgi:hypothetical protein
VGNFLNSWQIPLSSIILIIMMILKSQIPVSALSFELKPNKLPTSELQLDKSCTLKFKMLETEVSSSSSITL